MTTLLKFQSRERSHFQRLLCPRSDLWARQIGGITGYRSIESRWSAHASMPHEIRSARLSLPDL